MKVAVLGYGVEGKSAVRYWQDLGAHVTIFDEAAPSDVPAGVEIKTGKDIFRELGNGYDLVVRSPSILPARIQANAPITSGTIEFFEKCPSHIIGVTGTKGKGTTASLIAAILTAAGKRVHLVGNIGQPALEVLPAIQPADIVVYELSSFQLADLKKSPNVAIVLWIEPDHLDVHASMAEYIAAKGNIRRWQTAEDICFFHPTNHYAHEIAMTSDWTDRALRYGVNDHGTAYVEDGYFCSSGAKICPVSDLQLIGPHNVENACAAISAVRVFTQDSTAVSAGLKAFRGLPHRLQIVRQVEEVLYVDDSFSSATSSAVAAARSFDRPKIMILGGYDRGIPLRPMVEAIAATDLRRVLLIGQTAEQLHKIFVQLGLESKVEALGSASMDQIVAKARAVAQPGDVVVLSPGQASFDMFQNFTDRGEQFQRAVQAL